MTSLFKSYSWAAISALFETVDFDKQSEDDLVKFDDGDTQGNVSGKYFGRSVGFTTQAY